MAGSSPASTSGRGLGPTFGVGDRVEVRWCGGNLYYPARITALRAAAAAAPDDTARAGAASAGARSGGEVREENGESGNDADMVADTGADVGAGANVYALSAELVQDGDCNNHALLLSASGTVAAYQFGSSDAVGFGWSCFPGSATSFKYITGRTTATAVECSTKRTYTVDVAVRSAAVAFTDDLCGELHLAETIGTEDHLYIFIGANYLHKGGDATWNSLTVLNGTAPCSDCSAGTFSPFKGRETACDQQCAVGSFSAEGATSCSLCGVGSFAKNVGSTSCSSCPAGKTTIDEGASSVGSCDFCVLVTVTLSDSYGDGWNGASLYVGSFTVTLDSGYLGTSTLCLTEGKYHPYACGGDYPEEVYWSLTTVSGGASGTCGNPFNHSTTVLIYRCGPGLYNNGSNCASCNAGRFSPLGAPCEACAVGQYSAADGESACLACAAGTASASTGRASACGACDAGSYAPATGMAVCTACEAGSYCATSGLSVATHCAVGKYSSAVATACTDCEGGKYAPATGTADACAICVGGKYQSNTGGSSCDDCTAGKYDAATGLTADCANDCAAGSFSAAGAPACALCSSGTYTSGVGASVCDACAQGQASFAGSAACGECPVGAYANGASCVLCEPGKFGLTTGLLTCSLCAPGKSSQVAGRTLDCTDTCFPGSYAAAGASSCTLCEEPGKYAAASGATLCGTCATNKVAIGSGHGSTGCATCPGQYPSHSSSFRCFTKLALTSSTVRTAIAAWCDDSQAATDTYGDISTWDTSMVESIFSLMTSCSSIATFNGDISAWDVGKITSMERAFQSAGTFDIDLSGWDVVNVANFQYTFNYCIKFNQDISAWDVREAVYLDSMFEGALAFDQNLGPWNLLKATTVYYMFSGATVFNQALCWDLAGMSSYNMFYNSLGTADDTAPQCDCGPGQYYDPLVGSGECVLCPAGKRSLGRTTKCTSCAVGKYSFAGDSVFEFEF